MTGKIDRTSSIVDEKILLREVYVPEAVNAPTAATQGANGETLPENNTENYLKRPYIVVGLTGADKSRPDKETFFRILRGYQPTGTGLLLRQYFFFSREKYPRKESGKGGKEATSQPGRNP